MKGKHLRFELDDEEREGVNVLAKKLITSSVLALPQLEGHYTSIADACDTLLGCIVLQQHEHRVMKPKGNWSCSIDDVKTRYYRSHKKCLAEIWTMLILRPLSGGIFFHKYNGPQSLVLDPGPQKLSCKAGLLEIRTIRIWF